MHSSVRYYHKVELTITNNAPRRGSSNAYEVKLSVPNHVPPIELVGRGMFLIVAINRLIGEIGQAEKDDPGIGLFDALNSVNPMNTTRSRKR